MIHPSTWLLSAALTIPSLTGTDLPQPLARTPAASATQAPPDAALLAQGVQRLAFRLLTEADLGTGNLCTSPASLALCAAMAMLGAEGETHAELATVLGLVDDEGPWDNRRLEKALAETLASFRGTPTAELAAVNDFWGQSGHAFRDSFREALTRAGAALHDVDFAEVETARQRINDHIAEHTQGRIEDLIPQGAVTPDTRLVLTNAVYFKARWSTEFSARGTKDAAFTLANGDVVRTPTMHKQSSYTYAETDTVQALVMGYEDHPDVEMVVLLPKDGHDVDAAVAALEPETFAKLRASAGHTTVNVALPKAELRSELRLTRALEALGARRMLSPTAAEFGPMHTSDEPLFVSEVLQKTFLAIDEKGSEAAAATAMVLRAGSAVRPPKQIVEFRADHPYLVVIRNRETGLNLFTARVDNPRA